MSHFVNSWSHTAQTWARPGSSSAVSRQVAGDKTMRPWRRRGRNGSVRAAPQENRVTWAHWARESSVMSLASGGVWVRRLRAYVAAASMRTPCLGAARYMRRPSQPTAKSLGRSTCSEGSRCSARLMRSCPVARVRVTWEVAGSSGG